ncbi:MAG: GNAT family N-acetyltransferase [Reyranellaceae bacterium]
MTATDALEQIEIDAWRDYCAAAPLGFAQAVGLETAELDGPLLAMCKRIDHYQFNRLIGGGLGGDRGQSLEIAAGRFRGAGLASAYLQIAPGARAAELERQAGALGLRQVERVWVKFARGPDRMPSPDTDLVIAPATPSEALAFASAVVAGFGMPPSLAPWLAAIVGRPNWHAYVARDGERIVGGAAMYIAGERAWLGIGAVQADARQRGGQSALLARRVADGLDRGVRLFATETGKPLAGEPHPSFSNIQRAGFAIAYERPNWTV